MRVLRESSEDEMVACFLLGELSSQRFGACLVGTARTMGRWAR
jgi:hypothetical protein